MKILFFKQQLGFTLIELIVVFTCLAVLSAIGIASFATYSKSQALVQYSSDIISLINKAKASAASQSKLHGACPTSSFQGYVIIFNKNSNIYDYSLNTLCGTSDSLSQIEDYKLANKVIFSTDSIKRIDFPVLSGAVILRNSIYDSGNVISSGSITLSGSNATPKTININANGVISVN